MSIFRVGKKVVYRIKSDYKIKSSRIEYDAFLREAGKLGYELLSLVEFYDRVKSSACPPDFRRLVLRHDIDSCNIAGSEMFYQVERDCGAHATYYFRISTVQAHLGLIERLLGEGFEVGYHFEEAATLAKQRHLTHRNAVFSHREEIVETFRCNCQIFRDHYNPQLRSVCSHGDWINRHLGFRNHEFLDDSILAECGLSFEAYQDMFKPNSPSYISDVTTAPERFRDALRNENNHLYMLTHEGRWHPGPVVNTVKNLDRAREAVCYYLKLRSKFPSLGNSVFATRKF